MATDRGQNTPTEVEHLRQEVARLRADLAQCREALAERDAGLTEALEQQTATAEVLRVIASSPTDLWGVLDAVIRSAARLVPAAQAVIWRTLGDEVEVAALLRSDDMRAWAGKRLPLTRQTINGRAIIDRQTVHVRDAEASRDEFPAGPVRKSGSFLPRTIIAIPLQRQDEVLGSPDRRSGGRP